MARSAEADWTVDVRAMLADEFLSPAWFSDGAHQFVLGKRGALAVSASAERGSSVAVYSHDRSFLRSLVGALAERVGAQTRTV